MFLPASRWVLKSGKANDNSSDTVFDPSNRTITWIISMNLNGVKMDNVAVTDTLSRPQKFISAELYKGTPAPAGAYWGEVGWETEPYDRFSSEPPQGKYTIGTIDTPVKLVVTVKVPDGNLNSSIEDRYSNRAYLSWGKSSGFGASSKSETKFGGNPLKMSSGTESAVTLTTHWDVDFDPDGRNIGLGQDLTIYHVMVYGDSKITGVRGLPAGVEAKDLKLTYASKFLPDSFTPFTGDPTLESVTQLFNDKNEAVADLVAVKVKNMQKPKYRFGAQIVNPQVIMGGEKTTLGAGSTLYRGADLISEASASTLLFFDISETKCLIVVAKA